MTHDKILLDHGSGGRLSFDLIREILVPGFDSPLLNQLDDGAVFPVDAGRLAFSTDSYTVDPIFFPGGDIGELAVNGTVNDVAMCGGRPLYLSVGLILEEGFPLSDLRKILASMASAADLAGVKVVTGDTKVVPRGAADRIFINTSGVGVVPAHVNVSGANAKPGDKVILSGTMGDHGITVLTSRESLSFASDVKSDTAPLNHMAQNLLQKLPGVRVLRDPTRGGVATTLNEIAGSSGVCIHLDEAAIPVRPAVAGLCELLGFDPLYLANEGKMLAIVDPDQADAALDIIRRDPAGKEARIIGEVKAAPENRVILNTRIGGRRRVDMLAGEQLPRIC